MIIITDIDLDSPVSVTILLQILAYTDTTFKAYLSYDSFFYPALHSLTIFGVKLAWLKIH